MNIDLYKEIIVPPIIDLLVFGLGEKGAKKVPETGKPKMTHYQWSIRYTINPQKTAIPNKLTRKVENQHIMNRSQTQLGNGYWST